MLYPSFEVQALDSVQKVAAVPDLSSLERVDHRSCHIETSEHDDPSKDPFRQISNQPMN